MAMLYLVTVTLAFGTTTAYGNDPRTARSPKPEHCDSRRHPTAHPTRMATHPHRPSTIPVRTLPSTTTSNHLLPRLSTKHTNNATNINNTTRTAAATTRTRGTTSAPSQPRDTAHGATTTTTASGSGPMRSSGGPHYQGRILSHATRHHADPTQRKASGGASRGSAANKRCTAAASSKQAHHGAQTGSRKDQANTAEGRQLPTIPTTTVEQQQQPRSPITNTQQHPLPHYPQPTTTLHGTSSSG